MSWVCIYCGTLNSAGSTSCEVCDSQEHQHKVVRMEAPERRMGRNLLAWASSRLQPEVMRVAKGTASVPEAPSPSLRSALPVLPFLVLLAVGIAFLLYPGKFLFMVLVLTVVANVVIYLKLTGLRRGAVEEDKPSRSPDLPTASGVESALSPTLGLPFVPSSMSYDPEWNMVILHSEKGDIVEFGEEMVHLVPRRELGMPYYASIHLAGGKSYASLYQHGKLKFMSMGRPISPGNPDAPTELPSGDQVSRLVMSADRSLLVAFTSLSHVVLISLRGKEPQKATLYTKDGKVNHVLHLAVSARGKWVASILPDLRVDVRGQHHLAKGRRFHLPEGHPIWLEFWHKAGKEEHLLIQDQMGNLWLEDEDSLEEVACLPQPSALIAQSPDGRWLAVALPGEVHLLHTKHWEWQPAWTSGIHQITALHWVHEGQLLIAGEAPFLESWTDPDWKNDNAPIFSPKDFDLARSGTLPTAPDVQQPQTSQAP